MNYEAARHLFADKLRNIRKEKGITQEVLAERIAKSTEHISFLERGERAPSFEVLIDLATALEVPLSALMDFYLPTGTRQSGRERLREAFRSIRAMQELANEYGINDIFQDNGGKVLQVCILLNLRVSGRREGNDAYDADGNEYELKTINRSLAKNRGITTHHHLNKEIIKKYRFVKAWFIAIYEGIELVEIYEVAPSILEPLFQKWEQEIETKSIQLNNPKIPMRYVQQGIKVYPKDIPDS